MMSAQRDSRRRFPALPCPAISTETPAPCRLLDGQPAPFFLGLDIANRQRPCRPCFEEN
jgi:hypothetical protein